MDDFNPQNILLCLLSKQTGAHSSMHGMQCNWANSLCKDLSPTEQCEFKWYELKPSVLDEGLSSEGLWMEPRTCWSLWELWALYAIWEMTASVRSSFSVWNTYEFLSIEKLFSLETPCSLLPTYEKHCSDLCTGFITQEYIEAKKVKERMTRS